MARNRAGRPRREEAVERSVAIFADRWTFLVLREAFFGVHRFSDFRRNLGVARNTLSDRLNRLVGDGLLRRDPVADTNQWQEYRLTPAGLALYPLIVAIKEWGEKWLSPRPTRRLRIHHRDCGGTVRLRLLCESCQEEVTAQSASYQAVLGQGDD